MASEKRYQVFVSSTYEDLLEERQEVIQALLELDAIPSGMELFPAANDDQWTLIKRVIDDCDYYLLIVGGRYGSIGAEGKSYTQMEYEYAVSKNKPVISFLHKDPLSLPAKRTERSEDGKNKLSDFRALVERRMCKYWNSPAELGSVVSRSLIKLIKTTAAIGWVRANEIRGAASAEEVLRLKKKIEELEEELEQIGSRVPAGTENLAQGNVKVMVHFGFTCRMATDGATKSGLTWGVNISWDDMFARISPLMIDSAPDTALLQKLNELTKEKAQPLLNEMAEWKDARIVTLDINDDDFRGIIVQYRALKMIVECERPKATGDTAIYFRLTPYGDQIMTKLRAIVRPPATSTSAVTRKTPVVATKKRKAVSTGKAKGTVKEQAAAKDKLKKQNGNKGV